MHYLHLFFAIFCGTLCVANIAAMVYYYRKFRLVLVTNGFAAALTAVATLINCVQL